MFKPIKYIPFSSIVISSLLLTACGANSTAESDPNVIIQTAVALTVAAQDAARATSTSAPVQPVYTQTPVQFAPTGSPIPPAILPTRTKSSAAASVCAQAELVSETIPDGMIFTPGSQFTKTWEIKNVSNCSWTTGYKIVFWDGDVLGGAYVYNLPQAVDPGQSVPISLVLTAPKADDTYTSKWMLQTADNVNFGVGEYSQPFYAEIVVSSSTKPNTDVTALDLNVVRVPATGCPANVNHIAYATFTSNGPIEFTYFWTQSDGNNSNQKVIKMAAAGKVTVSREWKIHLGSNTGTKSFGIVVVDPHHHNYPPVEFTYLCGS